MKTSPRLALVLGLLCAACGSAAWAQTAAPVKAAAPAASAAISPSAPAKPRAHVVVIEDDGTRIEEVRSRGTVQRITVQSKVPGVRPYEIEVALPGRDPSQERGNAGRRTWSILNF